MKSWLRTCFLCADVIDGNTSSPGSLGEALPADLVIYYSLSSPKPKLRPVDGCGKTMVLHLSWCRMPIRVKHSDCAQVEALQSVLVIYEFPQFVAPESHYWLMTRSSCLVQTRDATGLGPKALAEPVVRKCFVFMKLARRPRGFRRGDVDENVAVIAFSL